jgi:hypothetical protein
MEKFKNNAENKNEKRPETASERYAFLMTEIFDKLDAMKTYLTYHRIDASQAHWGHVGSAAHMNQLLDEMANFIGIGNEE